MGRGKNKLTCVKTCMSCSCMYVHVINMELHVCACHKYAAAHTLSSCMNTGHDEV